jgi:hypothetical protein
MFVRGLRSRIGTVGDSRHRLAVILGPLAFDHSDEDVRRLIRSGFALALQQNVAVGFHLDDSMFWAKRTDLWRNPANVEWLDWEGMPSTGRRIDWGPKPTKLPPQMCYNSPPIRAEVRRRATRVIGPAIRAGLDRLRKAGKPDLFAGVIVGWETHIGKDFDTGRDLGYHALSNLGFRKAHPPHDLEKVEEKIIQAFITLWCKGIADAGVPTNRIYSHTAFLYRRIYDRPPAPKPSYSRLNHFAPPSVAFGWYRRPGFSTYPQPGLFEQLYGELARHGHPAWASSEGTNLQLGGRAGESGMSMETYLGRVFNHGGTLANVFAWGIGGEANKTSDFRVATEGEEAIRAYRKFLRGERLVEKATTTSYMDRLPAKIHRIQRELPGWVQRTGRQAEAEPLMKRLDTALKANDFTEAEKVADELLRKIASP